MNPQLGFSFDAAAPLQIAIPADPVAYFREIISQHHAAMMAGDEKRVAELRDKADSLAIDMNGGARLGIKGGPEAPCAVLERATQAVDGDVPLWGQTGNFVVTVADVRVLVEIDGVYGLGSAISHWPGFDARRVDQEKPFPISESGYRSFIGDRAAVAANITPDAYVIAVMSDYLATLKPKKKRRA